MVSDSISTISAAQVKEITQRVDDVGKPTMQPFKKAVTDANVYAKEGIEESIDFNEKSLEHIIEKMNKYISVFDVKASFDVDKPTGRTIVRIRNSETKEIIKEFPPPQFLKIAAKLSELMGLMIDKKI